MSKPVIVYGSRMLGTMLFYDAMKHPDFRIACFAVDQSFLNAEGRFCGLPQVDFGTIAQSYPKDRYDLIALFPGYAREREEIYLKAKASGYKIRNYISATCEIASDVRMGENNVIFGQTHIGFGGVMGSSNTIRHQVYVGHEFTIGSFNVLAPDCRIGGRCNIGNRCYIGLGSTIKDQLDISDETLAGAGSVVIRDTEPYSKNVGNPSRIIGYHQDTGIQFGLRNG